MFCKNCGNEIKEGTAFCSKCGTKIATVERSNSGDSLKSNNVNIENSSEISRDTYIGKAYVFDYYIGVNLRSFRINRRAVGFNDDNLLYCKGLRKTQIPYSMIKEIKDETKVSSYAVFCIAVFIIVAIICFACSLIWVALISVALGVLTILCRNCRQISIVTTDNKVFGVKVVQKNKETDEFLTYLKNETGIR